MKISSCITPITNGLSSALATVVPNRKLLVTAIGLTALGFLAGTAESIIVEGTACDALRRIPERFANNAGICALDRSSLQSDLAGRGDQELAGFELARPVYEAMRACVASENQQNLAFLPDNCTTAADVSCEAVDGLYSRLEENMVHCYRMNFNEDPDRLTTESALTYSLQPLAYLCPHQPEPNVASQSIPPASAAIAAIATVAATIIAAV